MTARAESRPRLLILSFSRIVSDARLLKQIALFRDDYDLTTCGYGPAPAGVTEHIEIPSDLEVWRYPRLLVMLRQYRRAYWTNPAVAAARAALEGRMFDVVIANDVDTVGIALSLQPRGGVHADLHEYAPRMREDLLRVRVFVHPFIDWMCRTFVARAQSWTTVGDGIAAEYRRRFGFEPGVVTNAAPYIDAEPSPAHEPLRLVHSGAAQEHRGLEEIIEAVQLTGADVTLDLYLVEQSAVFLEHLRVLAERTPARVRINAAVPYARLSATLRDYDAGIHVIPPRSFNHRWALPNKLFDFVQARLGVIVGPSPEMAAYVERYGIGAVTGGFTAAEIARTLDSIAADDVQRWKRASHGHARELSSEQQVTVWKRAVDALVV